MNSKEYQNIKGQLRSAIIGQVDLSRDVSDDEMEDMIHEAILQKGKESYISYEDKVNLGRELFYSIRKLDILEELIQDKEVTEIMINGYQDIFIERQGALYQWDKSFESLQRLEDIIQQIVASCNRVVNDASPIVDARLPNGSRVNIVLPPVALNGPIVTIRRFLEKPYTMEDLIEFGTGDKGTSVILDTLVKAGYNIFVSGGTGSGKTTFLNTLTQFIPSHERIITIEDSAELQIQNISNQIGRAHV